MPAVPRPRTNWKEQGWPGQVPPGRLPLPGALRPHSGVSWCNRPSSNRCLRPLSSHLPGVDGARASRGSRYCDHPPSAPATPGPGEVASPSWSGARSIRAFGPPLCATPLAGPRPALPPSAGRRTAGSGPRGRLSCSASSEGPSNFASDVQPRSGAAACPSSTSSRHASTWPAWSLRHSAPQTAGERATWGAASRCRSSSGGAP
mmetsp:Transcript_1648/g.5272  ORF Transcript_1648/g.5272 Transcript_1648/m.5272 type:complete len:204 (-) Transcript_1648:205-816(-)